MAFARTFRFAGIELALWAGLYGAYLLLRNLTIGDAEQAFANASTVVEVERAVGIFHEVALQDALAVALGLERFFDVYYMVGFGPVIAAMLVWLGLRHRDAYRDLRTWLLLSIAIASLAYVLLPTAPPRLVEGLGIADTVGLAGHDTGSFAGVKFNPYAAMPSMHVGWSLLVGLIGLRVARRPLARALFALHPLMMAVTVTATGNHYFLDSIVGVLVALTAVAVLRAPRPRLGSFALRPALGTVPCSSH
jgi:PAP2 superfamily